MNASREGRWLVPADHAGLAWLQAQASAWLNESGVDSRSADRVLLALDEVTANVVKYASLDETGDRFEVCLSCKADGIELVVLDAGPPFDPREVGPAPTAASLEDLPVGGLGLTLVRRLAKSMHYERTGGKNLLRLDFER